MLVEFSYGGKVLRFLPCDEPLQPADDPHTPITWSTVIATHQGHYVLMYNINRQQWENPGGGREPGESCYEATIRETLEETSQMVTNLRCQGLFKMWLRHTNRSEYGALYTGTIDELQPFIENRESDRICLWAPHEPLEEPISELTVFLLGLLDGTETP